MKISSLPEELFEEIFSYLQLEDLLACNLVCRSWRNAINSNRIWFNLCAERAPFNRNKFELIPSSILVDPVFTPPPHICCSLTELCSWRLRFMQEAHLSRNWRAGRCVSYPITRTLNPLCSEWDDDVLLIVSMERREFSCYTMNSVPELIQKSNFSLLHVFADFFKLSNDKLVVAQCTLIQVYTKNKFKNCAFELSHKFLFNKSEIESNNIPNTNDLSDWYSNNIGLYPSDINIECDHNGEYFVGLLQEKNLNKAVFHIWNLKTGQKTVELLVPKVDDLITDVHISLHSANLHILLKLSNCMQEHTVIRCFSLETFKYTDLIISFNYVVPIILFGSRYILNIDNSGKNLSVWRSKDGSLAHELSCDFNIHPATLQFASSHIILAGNSPSEIHGTIKILSTRTFQVVSEFVTDYRVNNLLFVRGELILVCGWLQLGLWDIKTATKVHSFYYHDCFWVSPSGTKALVENDDEIILLQFW